jgi:hypothetical protein
VTVLTGRITQYRREEPEAGSCPCSNGNADRNKGREEVDDDQHGGAVLGGRGVRVDEVELEIQRRGEEGGELRGVCRSRGEEAKWLEEGGDEECDEGPESDEEGEQCAGPGEEELLSR